MIQGIGHQQKLLKQVLMDSHPELLLLPHHPAHQLPLHHLELLLLHHLLEGVVLEEMQVPVPIILLM